MADYSALLDHIYGPVETPEPVEAPRKPGNLIDDIQRGFGQQLGSFARSAEDVGMPGAGAVEQWGNDLADKHPSSINGLSDIIAHPITTAREAIGEMAPQIAGTIGAATVGARTGAAIGAAVGTPEGGVGAIPGAGIGAVIGGLAGAGAYTFGQEYGGIRQQQDQNGMDDPGRAAAGAVPATALEFLVGPEASATFRSIRGAGGEIGSKAAKGFIRNAAEQAVGEGATEVGQSAFERYGAGQSLTDQSAIDDYAVSGVKGAIGGAGFSPFFHGGHKDEAHPAVNPDPNGETDLLAGAEAPAHPAGPLLLTDQRTLSPDQTITVSPSGRAEFPGTGPENNAPAPAVQSDLFRGRAFGKVVDDNGPIDLVAHDSPAGPPEPGPAGQGDLFADKEALDKLFSKDEIKGYLRSVAGPGPSLNNLTNKLHAALSAGDADAAAQHVEDGQNNHAMSEPLVNAGADLVRAYVALVTKQAAPAVAAPPVETAAPAAAPVDLTHVPGVGAPDMTAATNQFRAQTLDKVLADPTTTNPAGRFIAELRKKGMLDATAGKVVLTPHEMDTIHAFEQMRERYGNQPQEEAAPAPPAAPVAEQDPALSYVPANAEVNDTTLGVPERAAPAAPEPITAPVPEPAAPQGPSRSRYAPENFQLEQPTEGGLRQRDQAQARREARQPVEELPEGAPSARMFVGKKRPMATAQAMRTTPEQITATVDRMLASLTGAKRVGIMADARQALHDGKIKIDTVRAIYEQLKAGKLAKAKTLLETTRENSQPVRQEGRRDQPVREDTQGPRAQEVPAALPEEVEAKAKALGPTKAKHFRAGAQTELGTATHEVPAGSTMAAAFNEGRAAVKEATANPADNAKATDAYVNGFLQQVAALKGKADGLTTAEASRLEGLAREDLTLKQLDDALTQGLADSKQSRQDALARSTVKPQMKTTRRGFLGAAGAAVVVAGLPRTAISAPSFTEAAKSGKLQDAVGWVAQNSSNPLYRTIAQKLTRGGLGNVKVHVIDVTKSDDDAQYAGMNADAREMVTGAHGLTYSPLDGSAPTVYLMTGKGTDFHGLTEETVIHEAIHAYVQERYTGVSVYLPQNRDLLKTGPKHGDAALDRFMEIYRPLRAAANDAIDTMTADGKDPPVFMEEFARSPDEALAWVMTNPDAQAWMKTLDLQGKELPNKGVPTMWDKFARWVAGLFGVQPKDTSAFGTLLDAGYSILDAGALDKGDGSFSRAIAKFQENRQAGVSPRMRDKVLDRLPENLRAPTKSVTTTLMDLGKKGVIASAFTHDLVDMAKKLIPSAVKYAALIGEKSGLAQAHDKVGNEILRRAYDLKPAEQTEAQKLLYQMTKTETWGFDPAWVPGVKADPALAARFNAMSKEAQASMKEMLKYGHDTLAQLKTKVLENIKSDYTAQIAAATAAGDTKRAAELTRQQAASVAKFTTLLSIHDGKPYMPLKRFGNYAVVGKSTHYQEVAAQAETDPAAAKELTKLQSDDNHYFVDFAESMGQAEAIAEKIKADPAFKDGHVEPFERTSNEMRVTKGELFLAFDQLRGMITTEYGESSAQARQLQSLVHDLYLSTLSDLSSRKSEMARRNVAGAALDQNMFRSFAAKVQADAHFLANLHRNQDVVAALAAMQKETKDPASPGTQAERSRYMNEFLLRQASSMEMHSSKIAQAMKGFTSIWMLGFNPAYYLQNLTQPAMMSIPYVAGKHGYTRTWGHFLKAYGQLAPMIKDMKPWEPMDLRKSPADVRQAVDDLTKAGSIDITLAQETGDFGKERNHLNNFHRGLRGMVQKGEMINRISTAIAVYRMERERGASHEAAVKYAQHVIEVTHGDYSQWAQPRIFNNQFASVLLQFKKFQLIQVSYMARMMNNAFTKDGDPGERAAARKALAYVVGHAAVMGGALGLPAAQFIGFFLAHLFGNDDEPKDAEYLARKWINDPQLADLILKGAPAAAGLDLSGKLGMGQMLSILPFADTDIKDRAGYNALVTAMTGPLFGGLGPKGADALGYMDQGDYYKALEKVLPNGLGTALKTYRESTQGVTNKAGEQMIAPEDVSLPIVKLLGFTTTQDADRYFMQGIAFKQEEMLKDRSARLKIAYRQAQADKDSTALASARQAWMDLQATRKRLGFKPQSMSLLLRDTKAPSVMGGVKYRKSDKGYMQGLDDIGDGEDDTPDAATPADEQPPA